jgi:quinohemoprotein ethanol dehydrogenase
VAAWKGRIYVGSYDGYLISLDAATGKELWRQDTFVDRTRYVTITGAPQIAGGKVVIGNGGGELGARGYVSAYDAATGEFAWRFFIVPGDPKKPFEHPELEQAAKTWDPDSMWDVGGGGTAWDAMAYDPELSLLYVGTGNGSPHPIWSRSPKGGDNLYLASILAIDPGTGRLVWHYQTTPGDSWDYTATMHMTLAELRIAGELRKVLMQAPKNGFFYVLDRATGELLSAEKYGKVNWATHVDLKTGRPVTTAQSDFSAKPKLIYPGQGGAHNWHPMSFNAVTGLVYIPQIEMPMIYAYEPRKRYEPGRRNSQVLSYYVTELPPGDQSAQGVAPGTGDYLQAWDPVAGRERWRIPVEAQYKGGGVLSTAGGLVFQGTGRGFLNVYAADTGATLASLNIGTSIMAAPVSYAVDGEQYVAVMAGAGGSGYWTFPRESAAYRYGNDGRIVAFKLGGTAVPLPPKVDRDPPIPRPPPSAASKETIARGKELFGSARCSWCHTLDGEPGLVPDLLALTPQKHALFEEIVLGGALQAQGMASFADVLSRSDSEAIHAYLIDETNRRIEAGSRDAAPRN